MLPIFYENFIKSFSVYVGAKRFVYKFLYSQDTRLTLLKLICRYLQAMFCLCVDFICEML
ncbi:hypothetical protein BDZ94DRAFT_1269942 [Collybia nuda]|uniref:Uncharacterized protein n=1 Tax=Collybia nuda TaxID=64659 RepID=A0A9P5XXS7_9AGAR|nr:hypothetical protein BDZ94DRAFT_1269942 [Collybia nuda]